jgi:hypothetical protein
MSECLVWSVSLASTEEQKKKAESERRAARKKNPKTKAKEKPEETK